MQTHQGTQFCDLGWEVVALERRKWGKDHSLSVCLFVSLSLSHTHVMIFDSLLFLVAKNTRGRDGGLGTVLQEPRFFSGGNQDHKLLPATPSPLPGPEFTSRARGASPTS